VYPDHAIRPHEYLKPGIAQADRSSDPAPITEGGAAGMPDGHIEIDERFMPEWVGYGVAQLEAYLGNQARFDDYYAERDAAGDRQAA
jgi:hypothetical protein